jgi:hypothetical protein
MAKLAGVFTVSSLEARTLTPGRRVRSVVPTGQCPIVSSILSSDAMDEVCSSTVA